MDQAQITSGVIGVIASVPEGSVDQAPPLALTLTSPAAPVTQDIEVSNAVAGALAEVAP